MNKTQTILKLLKSDDLNNKYLALQMIDYKKLKPSGKIINGDLKCNLIKYNDIELVVVKCEWFDVKEIWLSVVGHLNSIGITKKELCKKNDYKGIVDDRIYDNIDKLIKKWMYV